MFVLPRNLILLVKQTQIATLNYTGCNTRTVCLYNTNAYFLQMAAGGERNIESNQFAIDVSCFTLSQRYKNELSATSNLGRRFLPANVSI